MNPDEYHHAVAGGDAAALQEYLNFVRMQMQFQQRAYGPPAGAAFGMPAGPPMAYGPPMPYGGHPAGYGGPHGAYGGGPMGFAPPPIPDYHDFGGEPQPRREPKPHADERWQAVCAKGRKPTRFMGARSEDGGVRPVEAPAAFHAGAVAPYWVFAARAEAPSPDVETYMERLHAALSGRFVVMQRPDATPRETLKATKGVPHQGVGYTWRWWTADGSRVYVPGLLPRCRRLRVAVPWLRR